MFEAPLTIGDDLASTNGGRFQFEDGGMYSGSWLHGKAHGYGICTGPSGLGEFAGTWTYGYETIGTYTWPNGNLYAGEWADGRRNGVGRETQGRWIYRGEWTAGIKGRYGIRQSTLSGARYEGTLVGGLQDGFGVETYADQSTYYGQWLRGKRHGLGVRRSAPFHVATPIRQDFSRQQSQPPLSSSSARTPNHHNSMPSINSPSSPIDDAPATAATLGPERGRSGFVLTAGGDGSSGTSDRRAPRSRSNSLRRTIADRFSVISLRKRTPDASPADIPASPQPVSSPVSPVPFFNVNQPKLSGDLIETYMGEWRADKRSGYGISQRSDGFRYAGEWYNDKKSGFGSTTYPDGRSEQQGKYRDNVLIADVKNDSRRLLKLRMSKLKDRAQHAIVHAEKAAETAAFKADVAAARRVHARQKASQAENAGLKAEESARRARSATQQYRGSSPIGTSLASDSIQLHNTDVTQMTPSSANSATKRAYSKKQMMSVGSRNARTAQYDQVPGEHYRRSRSSTPGANRTKPDLVEQVHYRPSMAPGPSVSTARHRSTTSSQLPYASPTGTGQSSRPAARRSGPHSVDSQTRIDLSAANPSVLPDDDGSNWKSGVGRKGPPGSTPSVPTKDDDRVPLGQHYTSATSQPAPSPSNSSVPVAPPRRRSSATQRLSVNDRASTQNDQLPSPPVEDSSLSNETRRPSLPRQNPFDRNDNEKVTESNKSENVGRSARPVRRRRRPTAADVDGRPSSSDDSAPSAMRRVSMPSVVQYGTRSPPPPPDYRPGHSPPAQRPASAIYVLDDGVRRRLIPADGGGTLVLEENSPSFDIQPSDDLRDLAQPPRRYRLEPSAGGEAGGSVVEVYGGGDDGPAVWRREDVHVLSEQRREEIRRQKERDEQQTIVLRVGDIKDWCGRHEMALLFLTLNLTLAAVFYRMLSAASAPDR